MNAVELLDDIKRMRKSIHNRSKKRNESQDDFVKRNAKYRCAYCHKIFQKKNLCVTVEPFHTVRLNEDIKSVIKHYRTNIETLLDLNPELIDKDILPGTILRVPPHFKIFTSTHGICYCEKCGEKKGRLGLDHISYIHHLLKVRRSIRDEITSDLRKKIYKRDGYKCVYCVIEYGKSNENTYLTLDHKNPVVHGGKSNEENLCTCCTHHNKEKGRETYEQYVQRIKRRKFLRESGLILANT